MSDAPKSGLGARRFVFETFFLGTVSGRGILEDRAGRLRQAFMVDMHGYWSGADFVLDEFFRFHDGSSQRRAWRVTKGAGGRYWASADDLVGLAQATSEPGMVRWRYRLLVPIRGRRMAFSFDDRMYLMEDGTVLDVSDMRKFGIRVARMVLALQRG
ncbi:MAG: DUF3833 family protein [Alphaproteobacteria bacterium]